MDEPKSLLSFAFLLVVNYVHKKMNLHKYSQSSNYIYCCLRIETKLYEMIAQ